MQNSISACSVWSARRGLLSPTLPEAHLGVIQEHPGHEIWESVTMTAAWAIDLPAGWGAILCQSNRGAISRELPEGPPPYHAGKRPSGSADPCVTQFSSGEWTPTSECVTMPPAPVAGATQRTMSPGAGIWQAV